ncbi:MAG: hypothetical protein R3D62_19525 [Xanthobacteraceae bacterium]
MTHSPGFALSRSATLSAREREETVARDKHFRVEDERTRFETIDEMQAVLDTYMEGDRTRIAA